MYFTLRLSTPLPMPRPLDRILVDSRQTQLTFETSLPGGFSTLTVGMPFPFTRMAIPGVLPQPYASIQPFAHVELFAAGGAKVWEGQIVQPSRGPGGLPDGFVAEGYGISGIDDAPLFSTDTTAQTSGNIVQSAVAACSSYLRLGTGDQFQDPGPTTAHSLSEFDGMQLTDILAQLEREGDGAGTMWDATVWEAGSEWPPAPTLWWVPRTAPTVAHYYQPLDDTVTRWQEDWRGYRPAAAVRYTLAAGGTQTTATLLTTAPKPSTRSRSICVQGGQMTATGAANYAQTYADVHTAPAYAIEITRAVPQDAGLDALRGFVTLGPTGASGERPCWLVRASEWVQIADQRPFQITRTTLDASRGQFTLKCGDYIADQADLFLQFVLTDHVVKRHVSRTTRAKLA